MRLIRALKDIKPEDRDAVIAIGNFDGVHRGHQQILAKAKAIADDLNKPLGVLTFEPHPRALFRPDEAPFRITPENLKIERLEKNGVEIVFAPHFDWDFASQSAEGFIQNVIKDALQPAHIVVGYDFCFGQLRKGAPSDFKDAGIETTIIDEIADCDEKLSSSRIRAALRHGKIEEANDLLGWEWEIRGEVVHGNKRGRDPAYGVYATLAQIEGEDIWRPSATNIGIRPMFEAPEALVETFIFDFDQDIYGKALHVKPVKRLRSEAKFDSLDALIAQMAKDCDQARAILK